MSLQLQNYEIFEDPIDIPKLRGGGLVDSESFVVLEFVKLEAPITVVEFVELIEFVVFIEIVELSGIQMTNTLKAQVAVTYPLYSLTEIEYIPACDAIVGAIV